MKKNYFILTMFFVLLGTSLISCSNDSSDSTIREVNVVLPESVGENPFGESSNENEILHTYEKSVYDWYKWEIYSNNTILFEQRDNDSTGKIYQGRIFEYSYNSDEKKLYLKTIKDNFPQGSENYLTLEECINFVKNGKYIEWYKNDEDTEEEDLEYLKQLISSGKIYDGLYETFSEELTVSYTIENSELTITSCCPKSLKNASSVFELSGDWDRIDPSNWYLNLSWGRFDYENNNVYEKYSISKFTDSTFYAQNINALSDTFTASYSILEDDNELEISIPKNHKYSGTAKFKYTKESINFSEKSE